MIIIPDIHGRNFWKNAVKGHENEEIVFLGDYVDPYYLLENVDTWYGLDSLSEVIDFKKAHPDNVTLLLGNHDLSYLSDHIVQCRHDDENHDEIRSLLLQNIHLFKIAHEKRVGDKNYVFSHAGILPNWLEQNDSVLGKIRPGHEVEELNRLFQAGKLYQALGNVSSYRGGAFEYGSCIWADKKEHLRTANQLLDTVQVFGHTMVLEAFNYMNRIFCLDCMECFYLDLEKGGIYSLSKGKPIPDVMQRDHH